MSSHYIVQLLAMLDASQRAKPLPSGAKIVVVSISLEKMLAYFFGNNVFGGGFTLQLLWRLLDISLGPPPRRGGGPSWVRPSGGTVRDCQSIPSCMHARLTQGWRRGRGTPDDTAPLGPRFQGSGAGRAIHTFRDLLACVDFIVSPLAAATSGTVPATRPHLPSRSWRCAMTLVEFGCATSRALACKVRRGPCNHAVTSLRCARGLYHAGCTHAHFQGFGLQVASSRAAHASASSLAARCFLPKPLPHTCRGLREGNNAWGKPCSGDVTDGYG